MSQLKKNLFINVSYQLISVVIPLIVAPYVGRTIGAEGAGIYSYSFSVANFFALFGMLGIANYGNRTIASIGNNIEKRSEAFWNIWSVQVLVSLLSCQLYLIYCFTFSTSQPTIAYIQLLTVLSSVFDISWFFFGIEKFQITVFRNLIVKLLNLILIFTLVKDKNDLVSYTIIMVGGVLLNGVLLFPFLKNEVQFCKPDPIKMKKHIKPIIVLFFPVIAISIYKIMDKVMIGVLSTTLQTGYYEYAEKIIGLPGTIITAVGSVMLPRLSAIVGEKNEKKAMTLIEITMNVMMCLTFAMAFGIFSIATDFAPLFFGQEFTKSGLIMMWLAPSVVFQGWANVIRTQYLIPNKRDKIYVNSAWLGAVVNLTLNAIMIPFFDAMGAVIGTLCAEFAVAFYQSFKIRKEVPINKYFTSCSLFIIPSLLMVVGVNIISTLSMNAVIKLMLEILGGAMIYGVFAVPYLRVKYKSIKDGK